ncbi:MAG: hypothetical protein RSA97_01100, partial [Oscillospiraceae bacterium]
VSRCHGISVLCSSALLYGFSQRFAIKTSNKKQQNIPNLILLCKKNAKHYNFSPVLHNHHKIY